MTNDLTEKAKEWLKKTKDCKDRQHPYPEVASLYSPRSGVVYVSCSNCGFPLYTRGLTQEEKQRYQNLMKSETTI